MAALSKRRSRYHADTNAHIPALTSRKVAYLKAVAELGVISLPQLARLFAESQKATTRQMRGLLDLQLVSVLAIPRAALADPYTVNDQALLGGSSPNLYRITPAGAAVLKQSGLTETAPVVPTYGPKNALFLAHHLGVVNVRIFLEQVAHTTPNIRLSRFEMGQSAVIDLERPKAPKTVRPDAWFILQIGQAVLVGLVEVDRGTERGATRWQEKLTAYSHLFQGERLKTVTGYRNARVLVITSTAARRDSLTALLTTHAKPEIAQRFWVADQTILHQDTLTTSAWRLPGTALLRPLVASPSEAPHE